ncbi:MAG TPA: tetratricopeptide repeat protein [Candidatus Acidoferrales bacterium]|nr:tetratricopeptide repeat protein [Candidatus Acidoferrales bacterium]
MTGLMPDHIEQVFAKGIDFHRNGQLTEAEALYRQVLAATPQHLDSLNLLGVIALQTNRNKLIMEVIDKALSLDGKGGDFHRNTGKALRRLGRVDHAIEHFTKMVDLQPASVEVEQKLGDLLSAQGRLNEAAGIYSRILLLKPDFSAAHRGLGTLRRRQGRLAEAVNHLQWAVDLAPDSAGTHNDLGVALRAQGRLQDAVTQFQCASSIDPNFPEAHSNLGNALRERGERDAAAKHLQRAVQLKPNFPAALHNLALLHLAAGRNAQALADIVRALKFQESKETKALFVRCLKQAPSLGAAPDLRPFLLRALSDPWGRPWQLVNAAVSAVIADASVRQLITRAVSAGPDPPGSALFKEVDYEVLARDELLRFLLQSAPVTDRGLETLLTSLRSALLALSPERPDQGQPEFALDFFCALARQCFINEYVFALTESERERSEALCEALGAALSAKNAPVSPWLVVTAACYRPLHSIECADALLAMTQPSCVDELLTQQLREPAVVARSRASIPQLTAIENPVSQSVRQQYEENPYPRWVKLAPATEWAMIETYLRNMFPMVQFKGSNRRAGEILVAGCGTGQHSIETARRFPNARVLALDLSLASLAYAQAKTEAAGLGNVRYAQADILKLGTIEQAFDVIETTGVLHHLDDPWEGWTILLSKLRSGGFMRLGLYSRLARQGIGRARAWIAQRGYRATADDIRRCRQEMMSASGLQMFGRLVRSPDFASTSACRDLLFHVNERQLTLPEINAFLTERRLVFLGFELESHLSEKYRTRFPEDAAMTRLDLWHQFELDNPHTFGGMYQFWIQRPQ